MIYKRFTLRVGAHRPKMMLMDHWLYFLETVVFQVQFSVSWRVAFELIMTMASTTSTHDYYSWELRQGSDLLLFELAGALGAFQ